MKFKSGDHPQPESGRLSLEQSDTDRKNQVLGATKAASIVAGVKQALLLQ
jgi:hypothetical protein